MCMRVSKVGKLKGLRKCKASEEHTQVQLHLSPTENCHLSSNLQHGHAYVNISIVWSTCWDGLTKFSIDLYRRYNVRVSYIKCIVGA